MSQLLTPVMLIVLISYLSDGTYSLKSNYRFSRNFSWQILFTLSIFARNVLRGSRRGLLFNKSLDYGQQAIYWLFNLQYFIKIFDKRSVYRVFYYQRKVSLVFFTTVQISELERRGKQLKNCFSNVTYNKYFI